MLLSGRKAQAKAASPFRSFIAEGEQAKEVGKDTLASAFSYMAKRDDTVAFEPGQEKPKNRRWLMVG